MIRTRTVVGLAIALSLPLAWLLTRAVERHASVGLARTDSLLRVVDFGPLPSQLRESSGLAVSREHPGVFWSHNDSGDRARLYALDSTAALLGVFDVAGARASDWEDLDLGPCPVGTEFVSTWCLYVGDIGDNGRRRPWVEVYVIAEPDPAHPEAGARALGSFRFEYPDRARDAEALAVAPDGSVVIVTKGYEPEIVLFQIPAARVVEALSSGERLIVGPPHPVPFAPDWISGRVVTGASLSPNGAVLALRTYTAVYFYRWPIEGAFEEAAPSCFLGALEPGGEAVAFLPDGRLLISSESPGRAGHLLAIECAEVGGR